MRNLLALFAMMLLTAIGVGWYLGWYKVRSQPASVPGQRSVRIDIDTKKIGTDLQNGEQKFKQFLKDKAKEEIKASDDAKSSGSLTLPSPHTNSDEKEPLFQFGSGEKK